MKKLFLVFILINVVATTKVFAINDMAEVWKSNNLQIDSTNNLTIKDIIKKDNNYYVFKEYKKDSKSYFLIQLIDQNKKIIKEVQLNHNSYDYNINDTSIIVALFNKDAEKEQIQLYEYDYNLNIVGNKEYEYNDSREIADTSILVTNNYILYGFYYKVNHGQFVVNKYDKEFNLIKSIDEEPVNNGTSTDSRKILKTNDSLVFINKTEHYKATCQNASKVNQSLNVKDQNYCRPTAYGKIIDYYCDSNKCNTVYKTNNSDSLRYYTYDPETHKFYDVGLYKTNEVDKDVFIKKYKYHPNNHLCNNIYCQVIDLNNNMYAILNYSSNKSIKVYNKNNEIIYKSGYVNVENLLIKSNENNIVIQADQENNSYLYLLDLNGKLLAQTKEEIVNYIIPSSNTLLIYKQDSNNEILSEKIIVERIEIKENKYGKVEKTIELIDNQPKIKIKIIPIYGYTLKETKITDLNGKTSIITENSFYLDNESQTIEPIFEKKKNSTIIKEIIIIIGGSILFLIVVITIIKISHKKKRYA